MASSNPAFTVSWPKIDGHTCRASHPEGGRRHWGQGAEAGLSEKKKTKQVVRDGSDWCLRQRDEEQDEDMVYFESH
eukprot:3700079-Pleurochrysis_carterae.AAC.2